jgi:hypothetical protein
MNIVLDKTVSQGLLGFLNNEDLLECSAKTRTFEYLTDWLIICFFWIKKYANCKLLTKKNQKSDEILAKKKISHLLILLYDQKISKQFFFVKWYINDGRLCLMTMLMMKNRKDR